MVYLLSVMRKYSVVGCSGSHGERSISPWACDSGSSWLPLFVVQGLGGFYPGSHPTGIQAAKQGQGVDEEQRHGQTCQVNPGAQEGHHAEKGQLHHQGGSQH